MDKEQEVDGGDARGLRAPHLGGQHSGFVLADVFVRLVFEMFAVVVVLLRIVNQFCQARYKV